MSSGFHHLHKRKLVHEKLQKYPHTNKFKRYYDEFIYLIAIFGPIISIPQILKIYVEKNAIGVSIIPWLGFLLGSIIWFFYGFIHKDKPIMITNGLWMIANFTIVIGVLFYG